MNFHFVHEIKNRATHTQKPQAEWIGSTVGIMKSQTFPYCSFYLHEREAPNYLNFISKDLVVHSNCPYFFSLDEEG